MTETESDIGARRPRRPLPSRRRVIIEVAIVSLLFGVLVGFGWVALAPEVQGEVLENGRVGLSAFNGRLRFGQDVTFTALSAAAGVSLAVVFGARYRRRPVTSLLALVACGAAGAFVATKLGVVLGPAALNAAPENSEVGDPVALPIEIGSTAVLLAWPIAVVVATFVVALVRDDHARWGNDRAVAVG